MAWKHGPFWNKWADMNGSSIFFGVPALAGKIYANKSLKAVDYVARQLQETAAYLNAALKIRFVKITGRFGSRLPNGSWDGYIGSVMDDSVQLTLRMFPVAEQAQVVLFSKPFAFSWTAFITPLPQVRTKAFDFLIEPFDQFVWVGILACLAVQPLVAITFHSVHDDQYLSATALLLKWIKHVARFAQILVEQPLKDSFKTIGTEFRAVAGLWLLASIILVYLYKSVVVSALIRPDLEKPPRTLEELATSDFHVNTVMLKTVMRSYKPWLEANNRTYTDLGLDLKKVCFAL